MSEFKDPSKIEEALVSLFEAMENEARPQNQKARALLTELSRDTSIKQAKDSKKSTPGDKARSQEVTPSESSVTDTRPDSILEYVKKRHPDLTEEEVKEFAGGLLG
jgi:DNA-nicking Smr family endonuclease